MFICRFRLVPKLSVAPSPSPHSHVIITQRLLSNATTLSRECSRVSISLPPPPSTRAFQRHLPPTDDTRSSQDPLPELLTQDTNEQPFTQGEAEKKDNIGHSTTLSVLYARLNVRQFSKLATPLSAEQVRSVALRAQKARHAYVLDNLSRNVLDSPEDVRAELATALLSHCHLRLDPSLARSLFFCITPDHHSSLPLDVLSRIACILIHHPPSSNTETLQTRLVEDIAHRLELIWKENHGPPSSGEHIPVWALFRLVMLLSEVHKREHAARVLQPLVEMSYIPPEAIQRIDQSSGDFHLIITLTLVRSCIFWKWNGRALSFLRSYLGKIPSVGPAINRLCQDVLHALMEFPTNQDLDLGVSFIKDMLSSPEPILVSPDIVRQIYSTAERLRKPHIAVSLYNLTQYEPTRSLDKSPLPSGTALTWLLRYLSKRAAYLHLARHLVKQVVDRCEPIPLADRAEFIATAADSGFASPARALWERYSPGLGGRVVAGNAAMALRICSLFTNLGRGKAHEFESSGLVDPIIDNSPHDNPNDPRASFLEDEEDFRNFAHLVLTRYREAKEPLHLASREDINALARANIILGHFTEAFRVMKVVVDRKERPDLHDANVVLSGIANVDPRLALKMVRRMVAFGPKPDGISFGTVIHQAARQSDIGVIIRILRLARETGQQLTTKTVVTMIRASVALSGGDKGALRDNLAHALEIIAANKHSNHLATQNMGRFCVDEALRADDPALAFLFWERVLQPRAEWDDKLHVHTRRRIARNIRLHCKKGGISAADGYRMTYALRERGKGGLG
jgi:hypothetical protein